MSARAEDAARALSREQPTTADAAVPAPANNGSADAEGVEIPAPEPSGNKNLLSRGRQHGFWAFKIGVLNGIINPLPRYFGGQQPGILAPGGRPLGGRNC